MLASPEQLEAREEFIREHGVWGAGLLSTDGSIAIDPIIEDGTQKAAAGVSFPDNDYSKVHKLLELMGGRVYDHGRYETSEYNWTWSLETPNNPWPLITAILPYMPTHRYYLHGKTWFQMTDLERYKGAKRVKAMQARGDVTTVSANSYHNLVTDPRFVSGVLDARASIYAGHEHKQLPTIEVYSGNRALMEALRGLYGGDLEEKTSIRTNSELTVWRMDHSDAKNLYDLVKPNLLLRTERTAEVFEGRRSHRKST